MMKTAKRNRARIDAEADAVIKKTWRKRKQIMKAEIKAEEKRLNDESQREVLGPTVQREPEKPGRCIADFFCWGKEV